MNGGKMSVGNIKGFMKNSYEKDPRNMADYEVDRELSGQRVQVYKNKNNNQAVVVHRGTKGLQDVWNDVKYAFGSNLKKTKRVKHAKKIQQKAQEKYGKENISTLGHSLGSKIAREVGNDTKEVIELNPAYNIPDALKKSKSKKLHTIRSQNDPVSLLVANKKHNTTIKSNSSNPLTEHATDVLDRIDQGKLIGEGLNKKSNPWIEHIRSVAKAKGITYSQALKHPDTKASYKR
jgi:phage gp46-like protein